MMATNNVILAFYSFVAIVGILVSVLSIIAILNYEFGIVEAVASVLISGFAVDYVVHLVILLIIFTIYCKFLDYRLFEKL